jgi:hypothetical protein
VVVELVKQAGQITSVFFCVTVKGEAENWLLNPGRDQIWPCMRFKEGKVSECLENQPGSPILWPADGHSGDQSHLQIFGPFGA